MSQYLHCIPAFDSMNYGYWKACMYFFLKSIDVWQIVETGWFKPEVTTAELSVAQNSARLFHDKSLHALCQALSPSEFARI
jgi:NADPH-dependent 7-cyano-7-deazaguanine reductase QueF-like protein